MKTKEILTIIAISSLGLSVICSLVGMVLKKGNDIYGKACNTFIFLSIVLLTVSQMVGEQEIYSDTSNLPVTSTEPLLKDNEEKLNACYAGCNVAEDWEELMCWVISPELAEGCEAAFGSAEIACEETCEVEICGKLLNINQSHCVSCHSDGECHGDKDFFGNSATHCNDDGTCQYPLYTKAGCESTANTNKCSLLNDKQYNFSTAVFDPDNKQCACSAKPCAAVWNSIASECIKATEWQKKCKKDPDGSYPYDICATEKDEAHFGPAGNPLYDPSQQCCKYASHEFGEATCNNFMNENWLAKSWVQAGEGPFKGCTNQCLPYDGHSCS